MTAEAKRAHGTDCGVCGHSRLAHVEPAPGCLLCVECDDGVSRGDDQADGAEHVFVAVQRPEVRS